MHNRISTELETTADALAAWAADKPEIQKLWLFGSRVTGRRHADGNSPKPDSDLDIAIQPNTELLQKRYGDEDDFNLLWDFRNDVRGCWEAELTQISPWHVHLEFYQPGMDRLTEALRKNSLVVYERISQGS